MKSVRLAVAAAVVASLAVLAPSPAQAYPAVTVTVTDVTLVGGNQVEITATVEPDIDCDLWELTYQGVTKTGSGNSITKTFDTPEVDDVTETTAFATCHFDNDIFNSQGVGGGGGVGTLGTFVMAADSASGEGTITLLPRDDDGDGDGDGDDGGNGVGGGDNGGFLPNTGGERLAWLIIGGLLVLVGGGVVLASRRRDADLT